MKRDCELIRLILADIEKMPTGEHYRNIDNISGYDPDTIYCHIELLVDAGLIKGDLVRDLGAISTIDIKSLTWDGYDFLEAAQNKSTLA